MRLPCGCNNFHTHSKAGRLPRDRGISEEIELKDTSGYVISSASSHPVLPAAFSFSQSTETPRREECAHREAAAKEQCTKNISDDHQMIKIKIHHYTAQSM